MALFNFKCTLCAATVRRLATKEPVVECGKCKIVMIRDNNPPKTQVKEVLDNGNMPRRLERYKDAEELHRNRGKDKKD